MLQATYNRIVTIDADLENPPKLIPKLAELLKEYHLVHASRNKLPRISEKIAAATIGKIIGVKDVYSNLRAYRKEIIPHIKPVSGETFGAELLLNAWLKNYKIKEITYNPPPRRTKPRIGGTTKANIKILTATLRLYKIIF